MEIWRIYFQAGRLKQGGLRLRLLPIHQVIYDISSSPSLALNSSVLRIHLLRPEVQFVTRVTKLDSGLSEDTTTNFWPWGVTSNRGIAILSGCISKHECYTIAS